MKEFDYTLDYKTLNFTNPETRKLYRIGRGEQGVLIVRPYCDIICKYWRFKTPEIAQKSANQIYELFCDYRRIDDFIGMDMCRKFLEMGFTRSRRYANHKTGRKYVSRPPYYHTGDRGGVAVLPQEPDALTNEKAESARIFKNMRDRVAKDPTYVKMRKQWRLAE